ncbi:MAG: hypothetical protein EOM52_12735 [Clostridia bacterium]|nr:hypothetical protein [Clostridia bacterium]
MFTDTKAGAASKPTPHEEAFAEASEALQTVATGAMALFSAIYNLIEGASKNTDVKASSPAADQDDHSVAGPTDVPAPEPPKAEPAPALQTDPAPMPEAKPAITPDDITKACVALIKRKRENSHRIQALLQTYGVSQMSALDPAKYEAFMADLGALGE